VREGRYREQRNWGARILEYEHKGMRVVFLENEKLRVGVLVDKGTGIIEFNHKPTDTDFVWLAPGGVRNPTSYLSTAPDPLATFLDYYPGGWQEIFPNGGAPSSSLGASFGQHGEVSNLPWDYRLVEDGEDGVAVRFSVRTQKTPFLLEKLLRLRSGEGGIQFEETLTNESAVHLRAMWGHHIVFGRPFLEEGCRVRMPEGTSVVPHDDPIDPDGRRVRGGESYSWPLAADESGAEVDLSVLPARGTPSEIVYIKDLSEGWYEIDNPMKNLGFRVEWAVRQMPYLWFWQEFGASSFYPWYGRNYNVGLEPFSSFPTNGIEEAVENGTALSIGPSETKEFSLRADVLEGGSV
jgi:Domain of unknown function (DUF4432)